MTAQAATHYRKGRGLRRKQAEEALRQSEERFRFLVEQVTDYAILILDPVGRIVSWNQGAARIKGYSADEIIGEHIERFYSAEDIQQGLPRRLLEVAELEGRVEHEGWRLRKHGARFWANVVITALKDEKGRLKGFAKVTRDLTERKRAEEALRASEQRFRAIGDTAVNAIISMNNSGTIIYFNAAAQRIFGYSQDEMIDQPITLLMPERFRPDRRVSVERFIAIQHARVIGRTVEVVGRRKDGAEFPWTAREIAETVSSVLSFICSSFVFGAPLRAAA